MGDIVRISVTGLQELGARFADLSAKMQKSVARSMTNAGAQVIKKQAAANAPVAAKRHPFYAKKGAQPEEIDPGNLKRSVIVVQRKTTQYTSEHDVTVRKGKKSKGNPYLEGYIAEFGSVKESPRPWLRPALDQEKGFAIAAMKEKLDASLTAKGV